MTFDLALSLLAAVALLGALGGLRDSARSLVLVRRSGEDGRYRREAWSDVRRDLARTLVIGAVLAHSLARVALHPDEAMIVSAVGLLVILGTSSFNVVMDRRARRIRRRGSWYPGDPDRRGRDG